MDIEITLDSNKNEWANNPLFKKDSNLDLFYIEKFKTIDHIVLAVDRSVNSVLGYALLEQIDDKTINVEHIVTREDCQNQGIASRIYDFMESKFKGSIIQASVLRTNSNSLKLHRRRNFSEQVQGREVNFEKRIEGDKNV